MVELPKNITRIKGRKGDYYYYHQINRGSENPGARVRIAFTPDQAEFWLRADELNNIRKVIAPKPEKSFDNLIADYCQSQFFLNLAEKTRTDRIPYFKIITDIWGDKSVRAVTAKDVQQLYDMHSHTPTKARILISALSRLIKFGSKRGYCAEDYNPCTHIEQVRKKRGLTGMPPWPREIEQEFYKKSDIHVSNVFRFAVYQGQRKIDCLHIKWRDIDTIQPDWLNHSVQGIWITPGKTSQRLFLPLHDVIIDMFESIRSQTIVHNEYIFLTSRGQPWSSTDSYDASWKKQTPKVPQIKQLKLSFHGSRKMAVNNLLENGCTVAMVQAITDQSLDMIEHYKKKIDQQKLAVQAMTKMRTEDNKNSKL